MALDYRIERMQFMVMHGLNVPDYIENVHTKHDTSSIAVLKEKFGAVERVRFLSNAPGEGVETDVAGVSLVSAYLSCITVERKGHTTWIMDDSICCIYEGTIRVDRKGAGMMKYDGQFKDKFKFQDFEAVPNIKHKIFIRRVFQFLKENVWMEAVAVDFGWAKDFCGSCSERIVFFDFIPLKDIA
jgi:hypothetical protein